MLRCDILCSSTLHYTNRIIHVSLCKLQKCPPPAVGIRGNIGVTPKTLTEANCNSPFRCGRSREGGRLGRVPGQTHPGGRPRHRWGGGRRATPGAACSTGAGPNQGAAPDLLSPSSKSTAPAPSSPSAPAACWTFHLR